MALLDGGMPPEMPPEMAGGETEIAQCDAINCLNNQGGGCGLPDVSVDSTGRCVQYEPEGAQGPPGGPAGPGMLAPPPPPAPIVGP